MTVIRQIVRHKSTIHTYEHPYLFTQSQDAKTIDIWLCSNSADIPIHVSTVDAEYEGKRTVFRVLSDKFLLIHHFPEGDAKVLRILRINDGSLCDQKDITCNNNPDDSDHPPLPGDSVFLATAEGLIAIFVNGSGPQDSIIEIYGVSDKGKFILRNRLRQGADVPALRECMGNSLVAPTGYIVPAAMHFTEDYFIGDLDDPDVRLVKWHAPSFHPSHTKLDLPIMRVFESSPWANMFYGLYAKVYVYALDALILAHDERTYDFIAQDPFTALRSVNVKTLELNWSIPISHKTERLRYNESLDILIATGDADGSRSYWYTTVIDARTGAIRRRERISARCEPSPSGENIIVVEADGRVIVIPVAAFLEYGFPIEEIYSNDDPAQAQAPLGASLRMAAFYPDLEVDETIVAQYGQVYQSTPERWVRSLLVGETFVFLGSYDKLGFVVIRIQDGSGDDGSLSQIAPYGPKI